MSETIQAVAQARDAETQAREAMHAAFAALENTPEYQAHQAALGVLNAAKQITNEAEAVARLEAERACQNTSNKRPWPGVVVKTYLTPIYDHTEAREWARSNLPTALMLDKGLFEKAVLDGVAIGAPVRVVPTLRAYLDRDLSAYREPVAAEAEAGA